MKHTKLTSLLLVLAMVVTLTAIFAVPAWAATQWDKAAGATSYGGGSGTEEDPFIISAPEHLGYLAVQSNAGADLTAYFALTADLDMQGGGFKTPISNANGNKFCGHIDGRGHKIYNFSGKFINFTGTSSFTDLSFINAQGAFQLFYQEYSGADTITVNNCHFHLNGTTKSIVDRMANNTKLIFTNCTVSGSIESTTTVSAFLGFSKSSCTVTFENCFNYASVTGAGNTAAFVWNPYGTFNLTNCANYGAITSTTAAHVGAFVGSPKDGAVTATLKGCANYGTISMTAEDGADKGVGGLVGDLGSWYSTMSFIDCANYGTVSATSGYAGGIFGNGSDRTSVSMNNVLSVGAVTSGTADAAGQIAGNLLTRYKANLNNLINVHYTDTFVGVEVENSSRKKTNVTQITDLSVVPAEFDAAAWTVGALPVASAASLTLGDSLSLHVYAKVLPVPAAQAATHLYADGAKASVGTSVTVNGVAYVQFTVSDIKAAKMTEQLNLQLGSADLAFGAPLAYGVMDYAERMTGKDPKLDALLGALSDYAKAAAGEDVDVDEAYANVQLTPVANVDNTYATELSVLLTDSIRPIVKVAEGVAQVNVEIYGRTHTYDVVDGEVIIDCLTATSLNNVMVLSFVDAEGKVLGTTEYSVANCIKAYETYDVAKALAVYMQAVRAYNGLD